MNFIQVFHVYINYLSYYKIGSIPVSNAITERYTYFINAPVATTKKHIVLFVEQGNLS